MPIPNVSTDYSKLFAFGFSLTLMFGSGDSVSH